MKIIIADAGPIIALSRISQLELLKQLFGSVTITNQIKSELLDNNHSKVQSLITSAMEDGWLKVENVVFNNWQPINSGVDVGEASAIYLALQSNKVLLIIDDQAGRAEARYHKVTIIGTAAIIGIAKEKGLITTAKNLLYQLREVGYYIGDSVIEHVLAEVNEC